MPVAQYTTLMMAQLADTGVAICRVTAAVTKEVARSRLINAAKRLGVKVTTAYVEPDPPHGPFVLAEILHGDRTARAPTSIEALSRVGYYVEDKPDGVVVWWIVNDDLENWQVDKVGEWATAYEAHSELERYRWPRTHAALRVWREHWPT